MSEFEDNYDPERAVENRGTPTTRDDVHTRCGGQTWVDGDDFTYLCDPFSQSMRTYCCTCAGFVPLSEVCWTDTGESISEYRNRLRAETPGLLKAWRSGAGFLAGGVVGAALGLLVGLIAEVPQNAIAGLALIGGLAGALVGYKLGTVVLNRVFRMDYRRMR